MFAALWNLIGWESSIYMFQISSVLLLPALTHSFQLLWSIIPSASLCAKVIIDQYCLFLYQTLNQIKYNPLLYIFLDYLRHNCYCDSYCLPLQKCRLFEILLGQIYVHRQGQLLNLQVLSKTTIIPPQLIRNNCILICRRAHLLKFQVQKERINEGRSKAKKVRGSKKSSCTALFMYLCSLCSLNWPKVAYIKYHMHKLLEIQQTGAAQDRDVGSFLA